MTTKLLVWLVMPLSQVLWLILLSWLLPWRRLAVGMRVLAVLLLVFWSLPLVSEKLRFALEDRAGAGPVAQAKGDVAIVLGGMLTPPAWPDRQPDLQASIDRAWQAARLFKSGRIRHIWLAGGNQSSNNGIRPESLVVRDLLIAWGVPAKAIFVETGSRNTRENAEAMAQRLRGKQPPWLITSGWHMPRAQAEFECAGLMVTPYPVEVSQFASRWSAAFMPSAHALAQSSMMRKEWLGLEIGRASVGKECRSRWSP